MLKVFCANVRSLKSRSVARPTLFLLQQMLISREFHLILAVETWLADDMTNANLLGDAAEHYDVIRCDRPINGNSGGGVCAFVDKRFTLKPLIVPLASATSPVPEMCAFDLCVPFFKMRVIVWYRPPSGSAQVQSSYLRSSIHSIECLKANLNLPFLIFTDANFPDIDWNLGISSSALALAFLHATTDLNLNQLVNVPTRGNNLLDLILCENLILASPIKVDDNRLISDHRELTCDFVIPSEPTPALTPMLLRRNFRKAKFHEMSRWLSGIDWHFMFDISADCSEFCGYIIEVLNDGFDRFVPLSRPKARLHSLSPRLRAMRKAKSKAFTRRHHSLAASVHYKALERRYRKSLHAHHLAVESGILHGSPNSLYRFYRGKCTSTSNRRIPPLMIDGKLCDDGPTCAEAFASHFESIYGMDNGLRPSLAQRNPSVSLAYIDLSPDRVEKVLKGLAPKLSSGPDGIPALALKELAPALAQPLSLLFTSSMANTDVPRQFELCNSTPVYKSKGPRSSPISYRPINISSSICKAFELCINQALTFYLESNNLLPDSQFGFRQGRSTTGQLLCFIDQISRDIQSFGHSDVILMDYKAAFDTPPAQKVMIALESMGISSPLSDWLYAFISSRRCQVRCNDSLSRQITMTTGLCQGSPISATAYIIYVASLAFELENIGVSCFFYADDLKLSSPDPKLLTHALSIVESWCVDWQTTLASSKCLCIRFGDGAIPDYFIAGIPLNKLVEPAYRDLGVLIDTKFSFHAHVLNIVAKARKVAAIILRSFSSKNPHILFRAFSVYARPLLEFSSPVWNSISDADSTLIERVQRYFTYRAFRRMNSKKISYFRRLKMLGAQSLLFRRKFADVCFVHASMSKKHYCPIFVAQPQLSSIITRASTRLATEINPSPFRQRFAPIRTDKIWYKIPSQITLLSAKAFKSNQIVSSLCEAACLKIN